MKKLVNMKKKNFRKGVTLVELLIVIAIVGLMAGVAYVNLQGMKPRKETEVAARRIAALLRETQNNAVSGKMIGGNTTCRFYLTLANSGTNVSYTMGYRHDAGSGCAVAPNVVMATGIIEKVNLDVSMNTIPVTITYAVPHGIMQNSPDIFLNSSSSTAIRYAVCLNNLGSVEDRPGSTCP